MAIRVPTSFPITMTDIWSAVNDHTSTASKSLALCYTNSVSGYFDLAYNVSTMTMGRFRNYGPPAIPPTYSLVTTYGADGTTVAINECNINRWTITTTNVLNGTIFNIACTSSSFLTHYRFRDSSGTLHTGVNNIDLTISGGSAYCDVECIVDRTVESSGALNFTCSVPAYSPYHPSSSPTWTRSYTLSDVTPSYIFDICGYWGPYANSSNIECQIYGANCDKLKQIDTLSLCRYQLVFGVSSPVEIKQWSYTEIDNDTSLNILHYIEQGDGVSSNAIYEGYRYTYKLIATDIFGVTHSSNDYQVSCRTYLNIRLVHYNVTYTTLGGWVAQLTISVQTNTQYDISAGFDAYVYNSDDSTPHSHHAMNFSSPEVNVEHYMQNPAYSVLNNAQIEFVMSGHLAVPLCGEEFSTDFPAGSTEPISY